MSPGELAIVVAFGLCAFISVAGALGMATTMSMFRSAIFLMASFVGVAGLFILLAADLMGLLQVMMYIGGMLVMALFMVLFMHDPGGAMMAAMPDMMSAVENLFSRGLQQEQEQGERKGDAEGEGEGTQHAGHHMHGSQHEDAEKNHGGQGGHGGHGGQESMDHGGMDHHDMGHGGMDHGDMDMSMVTPVRKAAAWLAAVIGVALGALVLLRPAWPVVALRPDPDSARAVGMLLMEKYMVAFEGAGFLILLGIFGAVYLAHVKGHAANDGRGVPVARTGSPPAVEDDRMVPRERDLHQGQQGHQGHAGHAHGDGS